MKARSVVGVFLLVVSIAAGSAWANEGNGNDYLALGDSVTFGYIDNAGYEYFYPTNFVSYADYVGLASKVDLVDAGCPGETTSSFISSTGPDNGCRAYRQAFPLHVAYGSTQLDFATNFLRHRRGTRLVTINLGANDGLLLEEQCNFDPTCIENGLPQVLATVAANMNIILSDLRATGYRGRIIVINYYSLDYSDPFGTLLTSELNQAITSSASTYGAEVADVFSAFQAAASNQFAQGKTCVAGLLNNSNPATNPPSCDVHPSQSGHKLMAQVVSRVHH
jgi:lysophospholipase L1-like esterase